MLGKSGLTAAAGLTLVMLLAGPAQAGTVKHHWYHHRHHHHGPRDKLQMPVTPGHGRDNGHDKNNGHDRNNGHDKNNGRVK